MSNTQLNLDDDHRDDTAEAGSAEFGIRAATRRASIGRKDLKPTDNQTKKISKIKKIISLLLDDDEDNELGQDAKQIKSRIEQQRELSPEVVTPKE